ncbi:MAG: 1-deoxy-D-xylulose-5-phosphate synthase, partial [Candidatus Paceibacteria bacterium]
LCVGAMIQNAQDAINLVPFEIQKNKVGLYDMRFIKPLDTKLLAEIFERYTTVITLEDGVITGGFGSAVLEYKATTNHHNKVILLGVQDEFPEHGTIDQLQELQGISAKKIKETLLKYIA